MKMLCLEHGAVFVDAPVSGGVNAAAAGTLTFMVGADSAEQFSAAQTILQAMGAKVKIKSLGKRFYIDRHNIFLQR